MHLSHYDQMYLTTRIVQASLFNVFATADTDFEHTLGGYCPWRYQNAKRRFSVGYDDCPMSDLSFTASRLSGFLNLSSGPENAIQEDELV